MTLTLAIALWGAVLSTWLAFRQLLDRPRVRIIVNKRIQRATAIRIDNTTTSPINIASVFTLYPRRFAKQSLWLPETQSMRHAIEHGLGMSGCDLPLLPGEHLEMLLEGPDLDESYKWSVFIFVVRWDHGRPWSLFTAPFIVVKRYAQLRKRL